MPCSAAGWWHPVTEQVVDSLPASRKQQLVIFIHHRLWSLIAFQRPDVHGLADGAPQVFRIQQMFDRRGVRASGGGRRFDRRPEPVPASDILVNAKSENCWRNAP